MKKIIIIILLIFTSSFIVCLFDKKKIINEEKKETRAVFISYIDYSFLKEYDVALKKQKIDKMINNIKINNYNMIILQVRPFCDAIYNSNIFISSKTIVKNEGDKLDLDILEYFIEKSHLNNIKIYAWINPYRIRSTNNINDINKNNIVYKWLNTNKIEKSKEGVYLNPAEGDVLDLILFGIKEIVSNYKVDGILYDDYFYPTKTIDLKNYDEYILNNDYISINKYRINIINNLIKESYKAVKSIDKNISFGISPAGNIANNLNNEYLDINYLLKQEYLDFVMPQIYYGFLNSVMPFSDTVKAWNDLIENKSIKLYIALSLYKSGLEDKYANKGNMEWINNNDIIKREIMESRKLSNYYGFSIFRYYYLFEETNNNTLSREIINIKELLN